MKAAWLAATTGLALLTGTTANAASLTLYDGRQNTSLSRQGWLSYQPTGATETIAAGATTLTTTSNNAVQAGYFRTAPATLALDRTRGYTLGFNLELLSESHSSSDRAGFSLTALSSDKRGVELGFWTNSTKTAGSIWAQNDGATKPPRFTHGESSAFNPGKMLTRYDLSVLGNSYSLFANRNYQTPILSGSLRDYSPEGMVYNTPNFLFLGDNTTSAKAKVKIAQVDLKDAAIVTPLPLTVTTARTLKAEEARITSGLETIEIQRKEITAVEPQEIPEPSLFMGLLGVSCFILKRRKLNTRTTE